MPRKCSVPGCKSNYNSQSVYVPAFLFPKNEERRKQWISCINRKFFTPGPSAVICIHHFEERFIIKEDKFPDTDGSVITIPRKKKTLTDDSYPTIFPNQPHYLTKTLPKERKAPSVRREEIIKRDEEQFSKWCKDDEIKTLNDIKSVVKNKIPDIWNYNIQENSVFIYKVEVFDCPEVAAVIQVLENLSVKLYYKNDQLDSKSILGFILGNEQKMDKWTKFDSMLSFLNSFKVKQMTVSQKVNSIKLLLNELTESNLDDTDLAKVKFLSHQLLLTFSKQHRYNPEMIVWAAKLYFSYPAAYMLIRKSGMLILPHQSYIRSMTMSLNFSGGKLCENSHFQYLKKKADLLKDHEKTVSLLLDEIYVSPLIDYKGGNVVGIAHNCTESVAASTVQTFMISSLLSKNKDVVALIPVKNITGEQLHHYTKKVMEMLNTCGYTVLCLISDNNKVNRNMFTAMCDGNIKSSIENPFDKTKKIFFLFDTPHLIKSVRNNWLNQTSTNQTFFCPNPADNNEISIASLLHLKQIYDAEKHLTIKSAPKLTRKVLFPSSVERQNVNHALSIFHDTNVVSLQQHSIKFGGDLLKTKVFLEHLQKWWKIVNCKHPYKGKHIRDQYCEPITRLEHPHILFLEKFHKWLSKWKELSDLSARDKAVHSIPKKGGMLSRETEFALMHTTKTFIEVSKYLIKNFKMKYILLGKLQTDSLEACFGQYRQMNGGNYNISFRQIIESDKKLKLLSLIKLYSKNIGEFTLKSFDCSETNSGENAKSKTYEDFNDVIYISDSINISVTTESVLIYIAGYIAFKVQNSIVCKDCILTLSSNENFDCEFASEEVYQYMTLIDRGALKWPKPFTLDIVLTTFKIFQVLISEDYEGKFLKHINLKDIVVNLTMKKIIVCNSICVSMCSCGISSDDLVKKCLSVITNILINNYCKAQNDKIPKKKGSKRKLSTLLASK